MTTTATEIEMIREEIDLITEIEQLRHSLSAARERRRTAPRPHDALDAAQQALAAAQAKVKRFDREQAEARTLLASLNARLDIGDEDVSVEEIVSAEKSIERLDRLKKPATKAVQEAEKALKPLAADDHLALLAADALEEVNDVPVVITKSVEDAPDISPLIIVRQTKATKNYGTLKCSGEVSLHARDTELDLEALSDALEATGSEVDVDHRGIRFSDARWPLPRLSQPSAKAFETYVSDLLRGWHGVVSDEDLARRRREHGYIAAKGNGRTGLSKIKALDFVVADGIATGTATVALAAQDHADDLPHTVLKQKLDHLIGIFREGSLGGHSEAGEIADLSITETAVANRKVWDIDDLDHTMGMPNYPQTLDATIVVGFRYEPVEV